MVQVVENWAELRGSVRAVSPSQKGPGFATVAVEVAAVDDVEGFPNLVAPVAHPGDVVDVIARADEVAGHGVAEGREVTCRVRRASPTEVFAHPDGFHLC